MNGSKVREFDAVFVGPGMLAVISIRSGGRLTFEEGDRHHFHEDSYGNTYVYDEEGREFYVDAASSRWEEVPIG